MTLGLSSQVDLDSAVQKAQEKLQKKQANAEKELAKRRAKNLSAAVGLGQPSALSDDTPSPAFQDKSETPNPEHADTHYSEKANTEQPAAETPDENDGPEVEDVFSR